MIDDQARFRRHEGACPFYRENWLPVDQRSRSGEIAIYEIYCLREMPPETVEDQQSCMLSDTRCWRDGLSHSLAARRERKRQAQTAAAATA